MHSAMRQMQLTARAYHRVLKLSQIIMDFWPGQDVIQVPASRGSIELQDEAGCRIEQDPQFLEKQVFNITAFR